MCFCPPSCRITSFHFLQEELCSKHALSGFDALIKLTYLHSCNISVKTTSALISLNEKDVPPIKRNKWCLQAVCGSDAVAPHLSVLMFCVSRSARLVHKQRPSDKWKRDSLLRDNHSPERWSLMFRRYWLYAFSLFVVNLINRALEGQDTQDLRMGGSEGGQWEENRGKRGKILLQGPS